MNRVCLLLILFGMLMPAVVPAQTLKFSDFDREDTRDMNFDIIGRLNNKILVYKNVRWKHKISVYDNDMNTVKTVNLDFVPEKTFNVDFVAYPDFFYVIYQFQKKNTLHCMVVKMNDNGEKIDEPVEVDTTRIPVMANNKIYAVIHSEDRQRIMIFKIQTRYQKFDMVSLLFDKDFKLVSKNRYVTDFNERRENCDNFTLGNDGTFIFSHETQSGNRDYTSMLDLVTLSPSQNIPVYQKIDLEEKFIDDVHLKVDNLNNRYLINTFYYKKNRGSIDGLYTCIWDRDKSGPFASQFTEFSDSLRDEAKRSGLLRFAFDNYFIRQVIVKKDGGFILAAEDYTSDTRGSNNTWNRYDYLYNPYYPSNGYYYYNPYMGYYRPYSSFNNQSSTRYYCENILVLSVNKNGKPEWSRIIQKDQFADDEENFLSFSTMIFSGEIHFLFNNDRKNQIVTDQGISPNGTIKRNPTLKSKEKGYEFMPSLSKQIGAGQLIIPCAYRGNLCFAKVEF
ncbi:MAG: hypothetical protein IPP96_09765 [Chitinophagaceae bacterium]|nr:hypothetical protein [Chitinophagaceae bacterium]